MRVILILLPLFQVVYSFSTKFTTEQWCDAAKAVAIHNPSCNDVKNHRVCQKTIACKPPPECNVLKVPLAEKKRIVHMHNEYRNKVALGQDSRVPGGITAANMMALTWDDEVEFSVMCHASDCKYGHDDCRSMPPDIQVGQNLFRNGINIDNRIPYNKYTDKGVNAWYDEIADTPADAYDKITTLDHNNKKIGHYTQFVWAETSKLGCAWTENEYVDKDGDTMVNHVLWCNYSPTGNVAGQKVFEKGPPASKCPPGVKPNKQYKGLCGEVKEPSPSKDHNSTTICRSSLPLILAVLGTILRFFCINLA